MLSPIVLLLALLSFPVIGFQVLLEGLVLSQARVEPVLDVVVDATGH